MKKNGKEKRKRSPDNPLAVTSTNLQDFRRIKILPDFAPQPIFCDNVPRTQKKRRKFEKKIKLHFHIKYFSQNSLNLNPKGPLKIFIIQSIPLINFRISNRKMEHVLSHHRSLHAIQTTTHHSIAILS